MMNSLPLWKASSLPGKNIAPLLELQFFLLGQDIECSSGNRLLKAGFRRFRSSEARDHCSAYTRDQLTLWGFGLLWRSPEAALLVPKTPYGPRLLPAEIDTFAVWSRRELPAGHAPTTPEEERVLVRLLRESLLYLAAYEETIESAWRTRCLRIWPKKPLEGGPLAAQWRALAEELPR